MFAKEALGLAKVDFMASRNHAELQGKISDFGLRKSVNEINDFNTPSGLPSSFLDNRRSVRRGGKKQDGA